MIYPSRDNSEQKLNTSSPNVSPEISSDITGALQELIAVVAQLRNPDGGCPWDLAQTPQSLIPYIIEEAYETVDALERGEVPDITEELGDLLLQVVLQAQVAQDLGQFTLADVAQGISEKLIRRHPHVFGDGLATDPETVRTNWEAIKRQERTQKGLPAVASLSEKLGKYNQTNPPLAAAMKISQKAAGSGFEWPTVEAVWEKFEEELGELKDAIASGNDPQHKQHQQEELGDLLFTVVNLARWYGVDPEAALRGTNRRFVQRFELVEAAAKEKGDRPIGDYSIEELEILWQAAKRKLAQADSP